MNDNQYLAINWTDGVKISQTHFFENYFNVVEMITQANRVNLTPFNYGLLAHTKNSNFDIESIITETRACLKLKYCHAITQNGIYINFSPDIYKVDNLTAEIDGAKLDQNASIDFFAVVVCNPYDLIPSGEPDPEAIPLHHPYVLPKIELKIIPQSDFNNNHLNTYYLRVADLTWRNGSFSINEDYIPPVAKIKHHKSLIHSLEQLLQLLERTKRNIVIINNKNSAKYENNALAKNTYKLCRAILSFYGEHYSALNRTGKEDAPIYLINKFSTLASKMNAELELMSNLEKEDLLHYYYEWIDIKPSQLESIIAELISCPYSHINIATSINTVERFVNIITRLFDKLASLEYIGQRKENIVVAEDTNIKRKNQNDSWSIID